MKKLNMLEIKTVSGGIVPELVAFYYSSTEAANGSGATSTILTSAAAATLMNCACLGFTPGIAGPMFVVDGAFASLGYWSGMPSVEKG